MKFFVNDRNFYKKAAAIAIPISLQSMITIGVSLADTVMVADILFLWVMFVPLGALAGLVFHLPAFWIYFFLKIDQIAKSIWCIFRLKSGKWIKTIDKEN